MRSDAKAHADEDKRKKQQVEKRNQADSLVYSTEKNLKEYGDKIPADKKAKIEAAVERLKEAQKGEDLSELESALEQANQAWNEASEDLYKAQQAEAGDGAPTGEPAPATDDAVKDADFEVVDEGENGNKA